MKPRKREAVAPSDVVESLLRAAGTRLVLVGGQALAFWMDRYGVEMPGRIPYVSRDIDFLAESAADVDEVHRLARVLGGHAIIPRRRALTALVGQAVRDVSETELINVDVVFRVLGADANLRSRAVEVRYRDMTFRVMHPMDVLKSRVDNLHALPEKQNEIGKAQLTAAIAVAQAFLRDAAKGPSTAQGRPVTLRYAGFLERLATSDAGRKVAARFGVHVADAIEPDAIPNAQFRKKQLPRLARLMSEARRRQVLHHSGF
jgi:hypothetical protein